VARWFGDGAGKRDGLLIIIFFLHCGCFNVVLMIVVRAGRHPRGGRCVCDCRLIFVGWQFSDFFVLPVMSGFL
jgi:hypothetical protein